MVKFEITLFTAIIALVLMLSGIIFKRFSDEKDSKPIYITITGAVIIMVLGIALLGSPIQFRSGTTTQTNTTQISDNVTLTSETIDYSTQNTIINNLISFIFVLLGLGVFIMSVVDASKRKDEEDFKPIEER